MQAFSVGARSISSRSSRFAAMLDEGARAERGLEARKSERGEGVGKKESFNTFIHFKQPNHRISERKSCQRCIDNK